MLQLSCRAPEPIQHIRRFRVTGSLLDGRPYRQDGFGSSGGRLAPALLLIVLFHAIPLFTSADTYGRKAAGPSPWDLTPFYEIADPREAAESLRVHADIHGIVLDEPRPPTSIWPISQEKQILIHVFSGHEFRPSPGIETYLASWARRLVSMSRGDEKVMCIVQFLPDITMGNIIEVLSLNVKIYNRVGLGSYIARMPATSVLELSTKAYVRWIGEYETEYKYSIRNLRGSELEVYIYPFGGGTEDRRGELEARGVNVINYNTTVRCYVAIMEIQDCQELARDLWWIRGIWRQPKAYTTPYRPE